MSSIPCLIRSLRAKGIVLSLCDGKIQYIGHESALTDAERLAITSRRADVIEYLGAIQASVIRPPALRSVEQSTTFSQEMWWNWATEGAFEPPHFTLPIVKSYTGVDYRLLEPAIHELVARNNILRYRFHHEPSGLHVELNSAAAFNIEIEHLPSSGDPNHAASQARKAIQNFLANGISTGSAWLIRAKIIVISPTDAIALLLVNHIIADAASCFIISQQLDNTMNAGSQAARAASPQFADYAQWQRDHFGGVAGDTLISYWRNWMVDKPLLRSPDRKTPLVWMPGRKIRAEFSLPGHVLRRIKSIAKEESTTTFCIYFALFASAISTWSGQSGFAIRSTGDLRTSQALSSVIGNLICADPVRIDVSPTSDFSTLVHRIETEYRSAVNTRLPTLQRFLPYCAKPGVWNPQHENTIGASINFMYRKQRRNNDTITASLDNQAPWPPSIALNIVEDWAVQIAPIWMTLAETEIDTKVDLQFNSTLITDGEQRSFVSRFLESFERFIT